MTLSPPLSARMLHTELIWANDREVEAHYQRQCLRIRDETSCWYIRRGKVTSECERGRVEAKGGEWLLPGAMETDVVFQPGTRIVSIRFRYLYREGGRVFDQVDSMRIAGSGELLTAGERLVAMVQPRTRSGSFLFDRRQVSLVDDFSVEACFQAWLSAYTREMLAQGLQVKRVAVRDKRVVKALSLLESTSMRNPFTEKRLAAEVGIGMRQLRRLMEQETGLSPYAHYDRRRLELAQHALGETGMPVKGVAYELGFRAPPHFSNWFKKRTGRSPRAYRLEPNS